MDVTLLVNLLAPFLPRLLGLGKTLAKEASVSAAWQAGEASWAKAQAIWGRLWPKVEAKSAALEATNDAAQNPEDEDYLVAFRVQLKKLLVEDDELAKVMVQIRQAETLAEILKFLQKDESEGEGARINIQTTGGEQNAVIGSVSGGSVEIHYDK
ncbi:MAG: hypothetical protein F6J87_20355 [Spirulina sp. SIO3F2]|nr:hypothetical protein [Spirulina sp. SIO3F2]